jgi:UDP-N-acetylglucosamine--N-acetylmuramyl-(pentapeptide) pyrophosphoryl-undecaprenol N-acetylglucosamine transferase
MALVNKYAAMMIKDAEAVEKLMPTACRLLDEPERMALLEKNIAALARTDAATDIVNHIYDVLSSEKK